MCAINISILIDEKLPLIDQFATVFCRHARMGHLNSLLQDDVSIWRDIQSISIVSGFVDQKYDTPTQIIFSTRIEIPPDSVHFNLSSLLQSVYDLVDSLHQHMGLWERFTLLRGLMSMSQGNSSSYIFYVGIHILFPSQPAKRAPSIIVSIFLCNTLTRPARFLYVSTGCCWSRNRDIFFGARDVLAISTHSLFISNQGAADITHNKPRWLRKHTAVCL